MQRKYILFFILLLALCISVNCVSGTRSGAWLDDGKKYLCPKCKDKYASELAPCRNCGVNFTPYEYCYDCAKKLNRCQMCGKER